MRKGAVEISALLASLAIKYMHVRLRSLEAAVGNGKWEMVGVRPAARWFISQIGSLSSLSWHFEKFHNASRRDRNRTRGPLHFPSVW